MKFLKKSVTLAAFTLSLLPLTYALEVQAAPKTIHCVLTATGEIDHGEKTEHTIVFDEDDRSKIKVNGRTVPGVYRSEYAEFDYNLDRIGESLISWGYNSYGFRTGRETSVSYTIDRRSGEITRSKMGHNSANSTVSGRGTCRASTVTNKF